MNKVGSKVKVKGLATAGLLFITFLSAIQFVFLANIPEDVSNFAFVFITNVIGMAVLFVVRAKSILHLKGQTLKKGAGLALLLTGFNFFILIGSKGMDSVVVSSTVSLYFIFVTPILLLLKKKVNFLNSIATLIAIIALLLLFGGDIEALFRSAKIFYLLLADVFFALYVVAVSAVGEGEDNGGIVFSQMLFSALFSCVGWGAEVAMGKATLGVPTDSRFWISALFIGIFIRVIYGVIQVACQKEVSALSASLIFSSEIIITILMNPIMSTLLGVAHTKTTIYQWVGAILLIISMLVIDDDIMRRFGYVGTDEPSVSKKMVINTLTFTMVTLILSTGISLSALYFIRDSASEATGGLGKKATGISTTAMTKELENSIQSTAKDKAKLAEQKLETYSASVRYAASYASSLFKRSTQYPKREVKPAQEKNAGKLSMQLLLANPSISYDSLRDSCKLLGNMEDVFRPISEKNENVMSIYIGTRDGLMISYDAYAQLALGEENFYYEFRKAGWYQMAKKAGTCVFTDTYWDSYGRGLTITCVAPFYMADGSFGGCVAMDVLMEDLNESMVSEGIVNPDVAMLIDNEGNVIASKDLDPKAQESYSIFDEEKDSDLKDAGKTIIKKENGITSTGEGKDEIYVAFASIDSVDWIICILSPVTSVIEPANHIRETIEANSESVVKTFREKVGTMVQNMLILAAMILILVTVTVGWFSKKISDPLKELKADVLEISNGNLERRTTVDTDDEIGDLAQSFNKMTDALQKHITDIREMTAKEERIAGELAMATGIQAGVLPTNFDEYNTGKNLQIYASMTPAKEVGGDFYDFFMVDEDHLCVVIADVAGKGVPAALFMMVSKAILASHAMMKKSPAKILEDTNTAICSNNKEDMFVTVWLGILELSTGVLTAANAGHEYPAIRMAGEEFENYKDKHGFVIGGLEDVPYTEYTVQLTPGSTVFVYTDGVPEATDAKEELFGRERMLRALNRDKEADPKEILSNVREAVDDFVQDAEQFDDLTMLCFTYLGNEGK